MEDQSTQSFHVKPRDWWLPYAIPLSIVLAGVIIAGAILFVGGGKSVELQKAEVGSTGFNNPTSAPSLPDGSTGSAGKVELNVGSDDHIRGNPSAPVTIVEFSDLQCPFCQRFHPTLQKALAEYGDQVRWVYKHFPLDAIHPNARPAAEASECVAEQKGNDGFWQFVDGVFENQSRIGPDLYRELAQNIGLNMAQFDDCVSSRKYKQKVEDQYQEGVAAGVRGTPGSFVNGEAVSGAVPYDTLKAAIDRALQK